jgi:hypothetical protein
VVVVDRSGDGHDEVARAVVGTVVAVHVVTDGGPDALGRAPDGTPEGVVAEDRFEEAFTGHVGRVVVGHGEFFEDDAAFGLELDGVERRRGDHVGEDVDRVVEVDVAHPGVVAGVLLRGRGVVLAADRLEGDRDVERGARRRPLEEEVLEEVRGAALSGLLVAGAHGDPEADGRAAGPGHLLGEDADARREEGAPHECVARRAEGELDRVEWEGDRAVHRVEPTGPHLSTARPSELAPELGDGRADKQTVQSVLRGDRVREPSTGHPPASSSAAGRRSSGGPEQTSPALLQADMPRGATL